MQQPRQRAGVTGDELPERAVITGRRAPHKDDVGPVGTDVAHQPGTGCQTPRIVFAPSWGASTNPPTSSAARRNRARSPNRRFTRNIRAQTAATPMYRL